MLRYQTGVLTQDRRLEKRDAVLRVLRQYNGAIKQTAIAHQLNIAQHTVSCVIRDLVALGLVEIEGNTKARIYRVLE